MISQNIKVALLVTSYDLIKQEDQPFFLALHDIPDRIFLDYHYGKEAIDFDYALRKKIQLFLNEKFSLDVADLKDNENFYTFSKSTALRLSDIIKWVVSNTNADLLLVFQYSLGEKGEARANNIMPIFIPAGNYIIYGAQYNTKIEKYSVFTFQSSTFDIKTAKRIMTYNFPEFVNPNAAVDVFASKHPNMTKDTKLFHEIFSRLFRKNN